MAGPGARQAPRARRPRGADGEGARRGGPRRRVRASHRARSSRRRSARASRSSSRRRARARPGLRVIQGKRVATTSTSDLTERRHRALRRRRHRARRALAGGPVRGPRRPEAPLRPVGGARPRALRSGGRLGRRGAGHRHREGRGGRGVRVRPAHHEQRGRDLRADRRRVGDRALERLPRERTRAPTSRSASSPSPPTRAARTGAATTGRRVATSPSSNPPEEVGREAARRTMRKLGARTVRRPARSPSSFDPDAARSILGLLAGCVMGSAIWRKSSYLVGREGTRVASDLVDRRRRPAHPPRARLAPLRRRGPGEPEERRRREGRPPHVPLRQLLGPQARSREHGERLARRGRGRRAEHVELRPPAGDRLRARRSSRPRSAGST